jgi:hypothetical protein
LDISSNEKNSSGGEEKDDDDNIVRGAVFTAILCPKVLEEEASVRSIGHLLTRY